MNQCWMASHSSRGFVLSKLVGLLVGAWLLIGQRAEALVFADSGDVNFNTTAPTGAYADSGWQFLGYYGSYLGTAISSQHFITSQHFGFQGTSFVQSSLFTGAPEVIYSVDMAANGGLGYWDIAGSDLRVYQIEETFVSFAELYLGDATGQLAMVTGRGGVRGEVVDLLDETRGWKHTGADGVARWGTNEITGTSGSGAGTLLVAAFDNVGRTEFEAGFSVGDSGGGVFVNDGGTWKLAGVNYAIDGWYDTNNITGDGTEFSASLFDQGGFYRGSDGSGWTLIPDGPNDQPSQVYMASISANAAAIQSIITVPEPSGLGLVALVLVGVVLRRRRA